MSKISFLVLIFFGVVALATPSHSTRLLINKTEEALEQLFENAKAFANKFEGESTPENLPPSSSSQEWQGKPVEIQDEFKKYFDGDFSGSITFDSHGKVKIYFNKAIEIHAELKKSLEATQSLLKKSGANKEVNIFLTKAIELNDELSKSLEVGLSHSGTFELQGQIKIYCEKAIEIHAELKKCLLDAQSHLKASGGFSSEIQASFDKVFEVHGQIKKYLDLALSKSGGFDIKSEPNKFFGGALPPTEAGDINEDGENYRNFALSPSGRFGLDEIENEVAKKYDGSLTASKKGSFDVEAENYHNFALSPADRLEEKQAEVEG